MDTIVTPVTVITLDSTRIVHSIKADLVARYFPPVVRLVQYDQSLPVIAVSLMQNGQAYTLPNGAAANIRVHKPDATYVYNPALGCDSTRNIVYFEVTQAMAAANGDGLAIVEIVVDGDIAGTSLITLHFEENPVPEDAIESSDEWETIYELGERIIASTVTPVSTAAGMTDHNVVYLYTGTESGWNQGHMYYYNGTTWVDAGIASTDKTLTVEGMAADAKATGDEITSLKEDIANIIDSAYVTDTATGAIASFPDGAAMPVKSLKVNIEPVQDLHGQDSPYPAGGGKNHLPVTLSGLKTINTSGTWNENAYTVRSVTFTVQTDSGNNVIGINVNGTATGGAAYFRLAPNTFDVASGNILTGCPSGQSYETCSITVYASNDSTVIGYDAGNGLTFNSASDNVNIYIRVASGTAVSNKVFKPMIRASSSVDATYAPYENICPISGHTQAKVTRAGVNVFPSDVTFKRNNSDNFIPADADTSTTRIRTSSFAIKPGTYVLSGVPSGSSVLAVRKYNASKTRIEPDSGAPNWVITLGSDVAYISFLFGGSRYDASTASTFANVQLEVGNTAGTYEPYNGQTVTIDLDDTRYGGTLDVGTGVLTVDRAEKTVTSASDISRNSAKQYYISPSKMDGIRLPSAIETSVISDKFKSANGSADGIVFLDAGGATRFNTVKEYASTSELIADLVSIQFVYPLATPFTVQLTANEISTLLGQNNIWSDTGDVEVTYRADTKLYIEKLTAPTEDDMIADHAISSGSFFMVGNTLYRATTAIASGATITVGTNATKLSLSDALNALA